MASTVRPQRLRRCYGQAIALSNAAKLHRRLEELRPRVGHMRAKATFAASGGDRLARGRRHRNIICQTQTLAAQEPCHSAARIASRKAQAAR